MRPRQYGRLFADDTHKRIFLNEDIRILIKISLKFVPNGFIINIPALVLIMAWRRPGDKPLSEPMLVRSLTHICVTRPQWVNSCKFSLPNRHMLHYHSKQFRTILWSMPLGFVTLHVHYLNFLNLVDDPRIHIHMTNNHFSYIHFVTTPSLQLITNDTVYD